MIDEKTLRKMSDKELTRLCSIIVDEILLRKQKEDGMISRQRVKLTVVRN